MAHRILVEIVCCSADDCRAAEEGGAHRIELCTAMADGGLTPSLGLVRAARKATRLPLMVMVRPRRSGFCYTEREFETMIEDVRVLREEGAEGIVFGILHEDGKIDRHRMERIVSEADPMQKVVHRCFDVTPDPRLALDCLIDLGIDRVLTSGQKPSATDAIPLLKELVDRGRGRIEVLPAGGLRIHNLREFVAETGVDQVHLAPHEVVEDPSTNGNPAIGFGGPQVPEGRFGLIPSQVVREVVSALNP